MRGCGAGATRLFRGMGVRRNYAETISRATPQSMDKRSKIEEIVAKDGAPEARDSGGGTPSHLRPIMGLGALSTKISCIQCL